MLDYQALFGNNFWGEPWPGGISEGSDFALTLVSPRLVLLYHISPGLSLIQTTIEQVQSQTRSLLHEMDHMKQSVAESTERNQRVEKMLGAIVKHQVS